MKSRVLILEDNKQLASLLKEALEDEFDVRIAYTIAEAQNSLAWAEAMVLDLQLPDGNGLEFIPTALKKNPLMIIIVVTAYGSISKAVDALRSGAIDFLEKPVDINVLGQKLHRHLSERANISSSSIVAESPAMRHILNIANKVATTPFPVLITGETGVGKEILAHYIHTASQRAPFISINCASIPEELTESILFGHVKGAFTGAMDNRQGLVTAAEGGTLFLDEVGELPTTLQPKLLRFLDQKTYQVLGSTKEYKGDVRIIAATNRNLELEAQKGRFRSDLYFRLSAFPIEIPPLRTRKEDIIPLANKKLRELSETLGKPLSLDHTAQKLLEKLEFPGNVRELFNILERASILSNKIITAEIIHGFVKDKKQDISQNTGVNNEMDFWAESRAEAEKREKEMIVAALAAAGGNKAAAARALKVSYKTLLKRMKKLKI